ncbi:MAG: hypothetical protein WD696_04090 [Bryobacteraceae bacterium]
MGFLLLGLVMAGSIAAAQQGPRVPLPTYSASTILPDGLSQPAPLAPGVIMSVYASQLDPVNLRPLEKQCRRQWDIGWR